MAGKVSHSLKVFLADDSAPIRARVAAILGSASLTIVGEGATPQGCVDGIRATHPDVVVLDVQLEGGSGLEVMKAVRRHDPGIAFVVFSNNAGPQYRKRYLSEGAVHFLDKSAEFHRLPDAVAHAAAARSIGNAR